MSDFYDYEYLMEGEFDEFDEDDEDDNEKDQVISIA